MHHRLVHQRLALSPPGRFPGRTRAGAAKGRGIAILLPADLA